MGLFLKLALYFLLIVICNIAYAKPILHKSIFEFNSRLRVQEEFNIFTQDTVSDKDYSLNELRILLNDGKTYEAIAFKDRVISPFGQAVAYNTLDRRWIEFKGKLLYHTPHSNGLIKWKSYDFVLLILKVKCLNGVR